MRGSSNGQRESLEVVKRKVLGSSARLSMQPRESKTTYPCTRGGSVGVSPGSANTKARPSDRIEQSRTQRPLADPPLPMSPTVAASKQSTLKQFVAEICLLSGLHCCARQKPERLDHKPVLSATVRGDPSQPSCSNDVHERDNHRRGRSFGGGTALCLQGVVQARPDLRLLCGGRFLDCGTHRTSASSGSVPGAGPLGRGKPIV